MDFFKTIDKIRAAFGNISAMERTHVDTFTENLIANIKGEMIAASNFGQCFVAFQNLADYEFLNVEILSGTNIKTYNGCLLCFSCNGKDIDIASDTQEITSDYSNVSNRWLTKISFIVTPDEKQMILQKNFETLHLQYKSKALPLKTK